MPGAEGQRERRCALRSHRVSLVPPGKVTTYTAERSCRAHTQSTHFTSSTDSAMLAFAKARLNFSPHWPVDFCAPKRLVFGFAACGAWICRLRHLSFACACACLALDLFVLVFFLFACGARTSSVQITLASLASVHRRRQNASNTQLFISYRSAAAPKAARISCCCWQIVWFAVCLFTAGRLRCHLVKQPLPAALDTGAGGAGVGVATCSGASRCSYLQLG